MTNARAANAYRRVDLESAPKDQILDRLLERFLADLVVARGAIQSGDIEGKSKALGHAAAIIVELKTALDMSRAPEICGNLARLYDYANDRLNHANLKLSIPALDDATKVMATVGQAFREARGR